MTQNDKKTRAVTLTELLVMMAVMVILLAVAAPVAQKLAQSLGNSAGARNIIDAAMTSARAIAVREQSYAGVRFQQDSNGRQYLVFIINDPNATSYANGFRAVEGRKPTALPEGTGVIAGKPSTYTDVLWDENLATLTGYNSAVSSSIVFNSSGRLVIHPVRFKGTFVFGNTQTAWDDGQDYNSINSFQIYTQNKFKPYPFPEIYTTYLKSLNTEFVNPYTGELVKKN
jgi:Tfp pilus assembly protein FimT